MEEKRECIRKAFMEMIGEMSVEEIRTQSLIERAGVSKATFYRLYQDKYDVMNSAFTEAAASVVSDYPDLRDWKMWSYITLDHVQKNKAFYKNILAYKGQNSFVDTIAQMFLHNILWGVERQYGKPLPEEMRFAAAALSRVNVYAMISWIEGDCKIPMETLVGYVNGCIPECLRPYF